ncbi:MAG: uroporphyrinogen-III C-methyltransferase [Halolamina sp.]
MSEDAADGRPESVAEEASLSGAARAGAMGLSTGLVGVEPGAESLPTGLVTAEQDAPGDADQATANEVASGTVHLVGGGPGDPELLTRRAWSLLEAADVVLHDSLTGDDIIRDIPANTEVVDVGKRPPNRTSQAEINELMRDRAREGEEVVRLKGGDPHVFGRGGEEAEYLAEHDVPVDLVPGVSSVLAAPSASGIPLTHRERASSVTVVTGHETPDKEESALDWAALADTVVAGGTLVVLMGVRRLPENVAALRKHGVESDTPVAMVQKATWSGERTVVGTLDTIVERSETVEPPAVTIVGDVVNGRETVAEFVE